MTPTIIKIIAADDHPVVIDGLQLSLKDIKDFVFLGQANNEAALYTLLQQSSPDILILDLNIKGVNSLEYLDRIYQICPHIKILIFSSYNTPSLIQAVLKSPVNGFLLKDSSKDEIIKAIYSVHAGDKYISPSSQTNRKEFQQHNYKNELIDDFLKKNNLSYRELEVIRLIVKGLISQEIAEQLYISKHTVQSHRKNILRKLNLHSKSEIVKFAYENNLV